MSDTATDLNEFFANLKIAQQAIPGPQIVKAMLSWAGAQGYNAEIRIALVDLIRAVLDTDADEIDRAARGVAGPAKGFEDRAPITVPEWAHSLLPENRS